MSSRRVLGAIVAVSLMPLASALAAGTATETAALARSSTGTAAVARSAARGQPRGLPGRVLGTFMMKGEIETAVNVLGERPGQIVRRKWTFTPSACRHSSCRRLLLRRERSDGKYSALVLSRVATGRYAGESRFYSGLVCNGQVYSQAEIVPYQITVRVTRAVTLQGIAFATNIVASYTNPARDDLTACPLGPSHDAARYGGAATRVPTPPSAAFTVIPTSNASAVALASTSSRGAGEAPIVAWHWQFGDPASGSADSATSDGAIHVFSAAGTYQVTFSVRDANGLTSTTTQPVTVS